MQRIHTLRFQSPGLFSINARADRWKPFSSLFIHRLNENYLIQFSSQGLKGEILLIKVSTTHARPYFFRPIGRPFASKLKGTLLYRFIMKNRLIEEVSKKTRSLKNM